MSKYFRTYWKDFYFQFLAQDSELLYDTDSKAMDSTETDPLLRVDDADYSPPRTPSSLRYAREGPLVVRTYTRRFWILFVFSAMACLQCLEWNTWGPISQSAIAVFPGWSSTTVAMMGNWGTFTFVVFIFPMLYLTNTRGLRTGVLICAFLMSVGTILRCITMETPAFTVLCHFSAIFVGIPGTLVMAAPPLIAAAWFPPNERTTATAFSQAFNQLGSVLSYLQPLVVRSPEAHVPDEEIKKDIRELLFCTAGATIALFFCILVWFPSRPPLPPSLTSTAERYEFSVAIKSLLKNKKFVFIMISYAVFIGFPMAWMSVLNFSFLTFGIHQDEAMFIGVLSILSSCSAALLVGRFTDRFYGHVKMSLIVLILVALLSFVWFLLLTLHIITPSKWQIYASVIIGVSSNFGASPLFFELGVESAFPAPEGIVGGVLTCANNFIGVLFLLLFFVPSEGYNWVTYCLVGGSLFSLFPMFLVKEEYIRSAIDRREVDTFPAHSPSSVASDSSGSISGNSATRKLHIV